jgi:hypothetical protein
MILIKGASTKAINRYRVLEPNSRAMNTAKTVSTLLTS